MTVVIVFIQVQSRHLDVEFVKLLHEIHADKIPGHIFKGFSVVDNNSTAIVQSVKVKQPYLTLCTGHHTGDILFTTLPSLQPPNELTIRCPVLIVKNIQVSIYQ